ncbi:MAG: family 16 glycosylhydrolase [Bacteroidota bacterium]
MRYFLLLLMCATAIAQKPYRGAEYRTKETFTYGRFEVRMKPAQRVGILSSFFTYNDNYPKTPWNEIDIEILGRYADDVQFNPITPTGNHEVHRQIAFNPSQDFHTYAFEWTPSSVTWFVDGNAVHQQTGAHIDSLKYPQKIMMNVWNPNYPGWAGVWNEKVLPAFAYYDWVSYSTYAPGAGDVGTGNNFKFQWKDDFNSEDTARWAKATHTWEGNQCDFYPGNIVFQNGSMIICLTASTATGFYDKTVPWAASARAEHGRITVRFSEEVDPVSAQTPANYIISGTQVTSAKLQADSQTVHLTLAAFDTSTMKYVYIQNVKDRFSPPNAISVQSVQIVKQTPITFPFKINCGGPAYAEYHADQEWSANVEYGHMDGNSGSNSAAIAGAPDATIYHTELKNPVKYFVRVPNGAYDVELQMAETFFSLAGKRVFSIAVQHEVVVNDLDLIAVAGANTSHTISVKNVTVTDGIIDIHFMSSVNYPIVNGIVVTKGTVGVNGQHESRPERWEVGQNYPNPFNGSTVIPAEFSSPDNISIHFYDTLGREVSDMFIGAVDAGQHSFSWNARDNTGRSLASGAYYYIVKGKTNQSSKKLILIQ